VWKANLPGDGCPDQPPPQPTEDPSCPGPGVPVPDLFKARCLPGTPPEPDCQVWMLQCVPGEVPFPSPGGPGWHLQADTVEPGEGGAGAVAGTLAGDQAGTPEGAARVADGFGF
jgi:hypothetical protein